MDVKRFQTPSLEYSELVGRLYGLEDGQRLTRRYLRWLGPNRRWHNRLSWTGIGVYDSGRMVGHLIVQTPHDDSSALVGFIEAENNPETASTMMHAASEVVGTSRLSGVFAPVDLSLWHTHRFTTTDKSHPAFLEYPQQKYYQALFRPFFKDEVVYRSYETAIPTSVPKTSDVEVTLRHANLSAGSPDWKDLYRITCRAFPDSPASPNLEEFIELYAEGDYVREPDDVLLAILGGRVVGYCFQKIVGDAFTIKTLAVDPDVQRQGIGRALYRAACERALSQGCRKVYFLYLREDRLISQLRPKESLVVGTSILYHSLQI